MVNTNRDTAEQITKELLVAWLPVSGIQVGNDAAAPAAGRRIGEVYRELLAKVLSGPATPPNPQ